MVNGLEYCTFNHRIPVDKVTTLGVRGDVFMNTVSIIEVSHFYHFIMVTMKYVIKTVVVTWTLALFYYCTLC